MCPQGRGIVGEEEGAGEGKGEGEGEGGGSAAECKGRGGREKWGLKYDNENYN